MKKNIKSIYSIIIVVVITSIIWSFKGGVDLKNKVINTESTSVLEDSLFNAYWYADKAEIKTYNLVQSRYGELHQGKATVIFVAQPFLKKEGVKPDTYRKNQVPVLKMNLLKKFGTGIYPYSMMLSTFTPIEESQGIIKASASGQEWCGQIFSQMNNRDNHYDVVSYSYFEEEGDTQFTLPTIYTEDEIWSRIRIDYTQLPIGDIDIIPGLYYTRLEQHKFKPENAIATLKINDNKSTYTLTYPKRERILAITFNTEFPYDILKWEETYADRRAPDKKLTTIATLDKSKNIDYWNYNAEKHKKLRKELNVSY